MTPADHAALSAQLARAIGYEQISVQTCGDYALVHGLWDDSGRDWQHWRTFDYRDPSVALPVLEWLMREHQVSLQYAAHLNPFYKKWAVLRPGEINERGKWVCDQVDAWGDTLPEAIARAAIAVGGGK